MTTASLRESELPGHFVSSFAAGSSERESFNAYKNSLRGSGTVGISYASSRGNIRTTSRNVEPMVPSIKISPRSASKNTFFSSDVRKKMLVTLLVATIFLVVLIPANRAFGGLSLGSSKSSNAVKPDSHAVKEVVVQNGDTLWSIAQKLEPKRDPRETVDQLIKARGTSTLEVGETIQWSK